ncbi:MAG: YhcH/YjgK/YiaL family protein [Rhodospirillaceae bacterium]|jgi:YhcH/YjgK/YiaL family protein|nr:YhcH/YjgK/YiaL family protein [Rhodospirillaceae bacterium]
MIFGHINHTDFSWIADPFFNVLTHLKDTDFTKKPPQTYELQGMDIYVQVMDVATKNFLETRPESHRKYIDVQFVCHCKERFGVAIDDGCNEISEDLLVDQDLLFFRNIKTESFLDLYPGNFVIFFPTDIHRPLCQINNEPEMIRKVVVKIAIKLLNKK